MGSSSNRAGEEANRQEAARQASIRQTQAAVNRVFDGPGREAEIQGMVAAMRELQGGELSRQKAEADRKLRFALARGGLVGGSTQIDQQKAFGEAHARGLLEVERNAQSAGASLRAADQDARARLIGLATSGLDATTGAQQAAQAMRVNLDSARSGMAAGQMGNAFARFGEFYKDSVEAKYRRRALNDTQPLYREQGYGGGQ